MGSPPAPLLDRGKLESAVQRSRNAAHYEGADLIRQAVILAVAISQSQAFLDGNKRAAFAAAELFLRSNGYIYRGPSLLMAQLLESVAEATSGFERDARVDNLEALIRDFLPSVPFRR